jgi:DNA-binding IclR family transcriptional regulator
MLASDVRGCTIRELVDASGASKSTIRRMLMDMLAAEEVRTYPDSYHRGELRYQRVGNVVPISRRR